MKKKIVILFMVTAGFIISSCTKLKEKVLDEYSPTTLTDKQVAEGLIAPVYAKLEDIWLHTNYLALQEISTDEAILPYRGGTDWGDNGIYISLHQHVTTSTDPNVRGTWNHLTVAISRALTAISGLQTNNDPSAKLFIAEARAMRAYYNLLLLDMFNVVFQKEDPTGISKVLRGSEAVDYIRTELEAAEPVLETSSTGPGRITKAGVWGLLARLYLNAGAYRNRYAPTADFKKEDMDKVVEYCDKIINSGQYQLASEYFSLFDDNNHTNKELIFAVDQRSDLAGHNRMAYFSLSGDQWPIATNTNANGTDGPAITPEFYQSWASAYAPADPAADPRFFKQNMSIYTNPGDSCVDAPQYNINRGILRGQQYGVRKVGGVFVKCASGKYKLDKLYHDSRSKPTLPVDFTLQVDFTVAGSNYNTGYRVSKYEYSKTTVNGRNFGEHDIVILRLADVYLMRAEAKLRRGDAAATALSDVNTIRAARTARGVPPPALVSMNLDLLLRERGFELYWECLRRTDMIRFGKYEGTWTEKNNTDPKKRIFPIPQTAIDGASNIPGYLTQNDGY